MPAKPLQLYTIIPHRHTASFYYRLQVPIEAARDLGLPIRAVIDTDSGGVSMEERIHHFCESDVVMLYQPVGEHPINNIRGIQSFIPAKRDGEWKWSPTVVMETDDNLFNVSPLNNAFKTLGIRSMDGQLLPLGHHIGMVRDGERKVLWADGQNGFSLARNRQTIESWRKLLEMADLVSCSTPEVANAVEREVAARRVKVFPNLVRFSDYEQVRLVPEPDKLKILWQGGSAHYEDWFPLREPIANITKKYPHVHWIVWGAQYPWITEVMPAHRYTFHSWCPYQEYKLRLAMMGHDISLAPLQDHVFNRCRSAIKWYEASVLHKPAATLAQKTGAYAAEIEEGKTALLFENPEQFEEKLSTLIENASLRKTLGENSKDWLSENRDAMKKVPEMMALWEELREERKREQPHVSEEMWKTIEADMEAEMRASAEEVPAGT